MKLGAEIGVRLLRVFYWALWVAEAFAVYLVGGVLFTAVSEGAIKAEEAVSIFIGLPLVVASIHYILTIPIGRKLAEEKADD